MVAGYFLLLAQKKVTKENGTLGAAPLAKRAVRYGWTGLAKRPSMAASHFLLLAQKKVTKEKGTLAAAVCRHPCRQTARAGYGVR